jgi:GNAT superfamily N-acetyltransferase
VIADGYRIRLANDADLFLLPDIEKQACMRFAEFGLAKIMTEIVTPPESLRNGVRSGQLWVAVNADDQPIGFALAITVDGNAHLDELDVLPEHGQHGLGAALVETVCAWSREHGYKAITLTTLSNIPWNAPFYARHGFRILASYELSEIQRALLEEEAERGLPSENRVLMRREL